jgi:hypothetical protein
VGAVRRCLAFAYLVLRVAGAQFVPVDGPVCATRLEAVGGTMLVALGVRVAVSP